MARVYNSGWRDWMGHSVDVSNNFVIEGLVEQMQQLDQLLASNPDMEKRMQNVIRKVLLKAQSEMRKDIHGDLNNDPRNAYMAVRKAVYRRILGGNINILQKRRRGSPSDYTPTRTLKSGQRGGNRSARSERTMRMDSYSADDRGFILRFLNGGARKGGGNRKMGSFESDEHRSQVNRGSQGGDLSKYGSLSRVNTGNRGAISPRNIFGSHLISIGTFIEEQLAKEFNDLISTTK